MEDLQKLELEIDSLRYISLLFIIYFFFFSCENKKENIDNFVSTENAAIEELTHAEILYTENGKLKVKIISNQMERYYEKEDKIELFGGVLFDFYKFDNDNKKTILRCERATINNSNNLMIANDNVILKSADDKELITEQLIWDKNENIIFTELEVMIKTEGEIITGIGFKSTPDFTEYEIKKAKGTFSIQK